MASKLDRFDTQNQGELTNPTLVLCEGKRDASFIVHLAENRNIEGIQVGFPDPVVSDAYGVTGFREFLLRLRAREGFANLEHIVILRDRDGEAEAAFQDVQQQIKDAGKYQIPAVLEEETVGSGPGMTVRLIPDTATQGNLDVLLLAAVAIPNDLKGCLDSHFRCLESAVSLSLGKAAKMRLTTIIAACCHSNPSCSLAFVWSQAGNPIPLTSTVFDALADFLRRFSTTAPLSGMPEMT